jgi:hypothetical protein
MRKVSLLAAFICSALPAAAHAQAPDAQAIDTVRKEARVHVGPLYASPTVNLKELGVDTNVFNDSGQQRSDFTFTVVPKADVWVPFARRALLTTTVASELVWYAKYDSERSINPQVAARGEVYLRRFTFFAENSYLNTRQRPNYEIDLRSRHVENDATLGANVQLTPKFALEAAAVRGITRYDADAYFDGTSLQQTLNRDTTGYRIVARHRLTPLTTIAVRYESLEDRFPYSPARDADSVRLMPGVEFKPRALVSGSAYVGYRRFEPLVAQQLPEFGGLVAQLGLSVRRAISRRVDVLFSTDRYLYTYRDLIGRPPSSGLLGRERVDTTWNYTGSIGYRLGRDGRIGFGVSYYDRQSTTMNFRAYNGLRAGTVVSYGF